MSKKTALSLFGVLVSLVLTGPLFGLTVLQLNLEQLTALSEKVFVGRCLSVKERTDKAGRPVQYVTFRVEEMLKGESVEKVTFKQIGYGATRSGDQMVQGIFREMPTYEVGEEAVVFLSEAGNLGLTAPVGLQQGKFQVLTDPAGFKAVRNGIDNRGLFFGIRKSPRFQSMLQSMKLTTDEKNLLNGNEGEIPFQDFISLVKKLATP